MEDMASQGSNTGVADVIVQVDSQFLGRERKASAISAGEMKPIK